MEQTAGENYHINRLGMIHQTIHVYIDNHCILNLGCLHSYYLIFYKDIWEIISNATVFEKNKTKKKPYIIYCIIVCVCVCVTLNCSSDMTRRWCKLCISGERARSWATSSGSGRGTPWPSRTTTPTTGARCISWISLAEIKEGMVRLTEK